ncbi:hypothetical protein D9M72_539630 [compost metagenome]
MPLGREVGLTGPASPSKCHKVRFIPTKAQRKRIKVATDYDEARPDVAESRNATLQALRSANAPDARSVVSALDEADTTDGVELPGADLSDEVLAIEVIPQKDDEFTCYSCFLVRHRSQIAVGRDGHASCLECEG